VPSVPQHSTHSFRSALASALRLAIGFCIAALVTNTWIVGGLVMPAFVSGGSMAPVLLGAHRVWNCDGCQREFACNAESLPTTGRDAICPHCGAANDPPLGRDVAPRRLWIDRSAFAWRAPRRWEAVVFRSPDEPEMLCVKRVVGLPGEVVDLSAGDVLIDGQIARKDPRTAGRLAVEISGRESLDRWQSEPASAWRRTEEGFACLPEAEGASAWLTYQHAEPMLGAAEAATILDGSPLDQSESRRLNEVADGLLRFRLRADEGAKVSLRAGSRGEQFEVHCDYDSGRVELLHEGRRVRQAELAGGSRNTNSLELIVADESVRLLVDGRAVLDYAFRPRRAEDRGMTLAIGASGGRIEVSDLEVFRDVYYTPGSGGRSQYRLGPGEYFVLGDNSAHSADSRGWTEALTAGLMLGPARVW